MGTWKELFHLTDRRELLSSQHLGLSVAGLGDIDGDGHLEFAAGMVAYEAPGLLPGEVQVFSGADGTLLSTLTLETIQSQAKDLRR